MRTNGLVGSIVIALAFVGYGRAAEESLISDTALGGDNLVVTDYLGTPEVVSDHINAAEYVSDQVDVSGCDTCEQETCCQGEGYRIFPEGWHDCLIGSCCAYHVYAGTETTFLKIKSQTGGIISLTFSDTTAPGVSTVSFVDSGGVYDVWSYGPRVWLGVQMTDKWGVRGRFWRIAETDQHRPDQNKNIPSTGTNFATIFTTDLVEAFDLDVEGVRSWEFWGFKLDTFLGARHAEFESNSDLLAFGVFTTGNFVNLTLQNGCKFEGSGVTYGGELRRRLFGSHLYVFGNARGSALDGHTTSFGRSDGTVADSPSAPLVGAATVTRSDAVARAYIFEAQGGVEFEWALSQIPANFFIRAAYEFQEWNINGKPTGGAGFGGTIGEITTNSFASASAVTSGMSAQGLTLGTGLTW